jgi:high-affinity iron transporter
MNPGRRPINRRPRRRVPAIRFVALGLALALAALFVAAAPAEAQQDPAGIGESLRRALLDAQLSLAADPAAAADQLAEARRLATDPTWETLRQDSPAAWTRLTEALEAAGASVTAEDPVALAAARGQAWTALLGGAKDVAIARLAAGDVTASQRWLKLREFRQATRFSRPDADATRALAELAAGRLAAPAASAAVEADLLDTYQARLEEALAALETAERSAFPARRAEAAALAAGYFELLAEPFAAERGPAAATDLRRQLAVLSSSSALGAGVAASEIATLRQRLGGFRAAPLSDEEQLRRAGQFRRFMSLVPVEYARGVHGGRVTLDLEIREAVTFRDGAEAAFRDLAPALADRDAATTSAMTARLKQLGERLADASSGRLVAEPDIVRADAESLLTDFTAAAPEAWLKSSSKADFDVIQTALDQMQRAVDAGDYALAESARLEAYAVLEMGPEAKLVAFAPHHKPLLEGLFWFGNEEAPGLARLLQDHAAAERIEATRAQLDAALAAAAAALTGVSSPTAVATNAGIIVLREGLEAVLILAALMASLKTPATRRYRKPLWLGAVLAMGVTALTFAAAAGLLQTMARYGERLEAVMSIVAVVVLLIITNWFFHKAYWVDWLSGFHEKKGELLGNQSGRWQMWGLVTLGFTSIYREGFETVLFAQALVLDAGLRVVLTGIAVGLAAVFAVGVLVFVLQARLPHRRMMIVTAFLIGAVLVTMVGNTVHVLQVVGWLPVHPIRGLSLPYWAGQWFGLYPTWEGLLLQLAAAVFALGSYFLAEHMKHRRVRAAVARMNLKPRTRELAQANVSTEPGP